MLKNLNNKGNTLGIVLVGICILSILGTLILGVTSTNYYMKLNDKKTEMVFYHTEKAVDELYTIIGNDVMKSAKEAYATVLAKAVKSETIGGVIEYKERENLSELFYTEYTDSIKNKYKVDITGSANLQSIIASWQSAITPVKGYSINVKRITTGANKTEVVHIVDSSTSKLKQIDIKNVCVECISDTTKNSVNIVTDFTIKVPEVVLNFYDFIFVLLLLFKNTRNQNL